MTVQLIPAHPRCICDLMHLCRAPRVSFDFRVGLEEAPEASIERAIAIGKRPTRDPGAMYLRALE